MQSLRCRRGTTEDHVGLQRDQFPREGAYSLDIAGSPAIVHAHIAPVGPSQFPEASNERCDKGLHGEIPLAVAHQHSDSPHRWLLRPYSRWPSGHTADKRDKLAPFQLTKWHLMPLAV
jgi:hypothetical protein